jgi:hypothetical protein
MTIPEFAGGVVAGFLGVGMFGSRWHYTGFGGNLKRHFQQN